MTFEQDDPFTGRWRFNARLSTLSTPCPQSWVQEVVASLEEVCVREKIVRSDGTETALSVQAGFDGTDYPVEGSPAVDTIAYARTDRHTILGTGKRHGAVSLTETVTADPEHRTLTLRYFLHDGAQVVASGIALFDKEV